MRALGSGYKVAREVVDFGFTYERPYFVDGGKFTRHFGFSPTSFEVGMATTLRVFVGEGHSVSGAL